LTQRSPRASSTSTSSSASPTACAGKTYTLKSGDTCHSVALSQKISTAWLLSDNHLASYCTDFPKSGTLCLVNTCDVYTVRANDTCKAIAFNNNITEAQLSAWNPVSNTHLSSFHIS